MRAEGIYENVDINEYHAEDGISTSGINLLLDCPKRYYYEYHEREKEDKNDNYLIGRAVHMLILEPEKFDRYFFPMVEEVDLRTKAGKEAYTLAQFQAQGREVLRFNDFENINKIAETARYHPIWQELGEGNIENSIYWNEPTWDVRLRTRPDFYNRTYIIDVKTTDSIPNFQRSIYSYGYHRQAAMQIDGLKHFNNEGNTRERFFGFFVIEKKAPYLTACFTLDPKSVEIGRQEYKEAAEIYSLCKMENKWPGYDDNFKLMSIPSYVMKKEEVII